ncbi:hypothetical protein ADIWIN_3705 [Winogradskyella psychrotolerans RS-3]|uniref:Ribosomal subunit interface protein n=1 Tax=Winogradskyella psychrotolerans RS-3 TaxID=641526 RepID=S7WUB3_9FLAO|nr:hypothetical protein [Winogradskyella psychrotolerans]EPR70349.1 hypothetical protein ADIWIN_3705 [Winogradskyella psychrotolerans RS-3]
MRIQFNTTQINSNKTIHITEKDTAYLTALFECRLENYGLHITEIDVHLSNENNKQEGCHGNRCSLSTNIVGQPLHPISFEADNDNIVLAILHAIDKLKVSLMACIKAGEDALHNNERVFCIRKQVIPVVS